jgi:ABC-type transporter MlaC component
LDRARETAPRHRSIFGIEIQIVFRRTLAVDLVVDVDFVMLERDGDWRVVDIVAEGVSYVKSYRSQFRVDIAADGIDSVLEWLERKTAPRNALPP